MKKLTVIITILALCVGNTVMAQKLTRKMESAAEKYVKAWVRADKSLSKGKRSSEAREEAMATLKKRKVIYIDEATEKKLKKREEIVTDAELTTALDKIKDLKDKEAELLRSLVKKGRLKSEPRLLIYRLILYKGNELQKEKNQAIADGKALRHEALKNIYKHFQSRTTELSKPPATIEEVALPAEMAMFEGKTAWLFLYGPAKLKSERGNLVFAEPTADSAGNVYGITDQGAIVTMQYAMFMAEVKKARERAAPTPAPAPNPGPAPAPETNPAPAPQPQNLDAYDSKIALALKNIIQKIAAKQQQTRKLPATLIDAGVAEADTKFSSADGSETKDWIYLGNRVQAQVAPNKFVLIMAPFPSADGNYFCILNDSNFIKMPANQAKKIAAALKQAPAGKKPEEKKEPETNFVPQ